ncbi:MAG: hydroxymethylglutaryl-CoA lyase [Solirubrobacterales bacterium]|nr:hydroxymethylglutaryl-CoA lyase [Solirubrobacterales bacterium]
MPSHTEITICDVGPRDGLQNESRSLPPDVRAELCNRLASAGLPRVEAVSFVNPKRVPQMAGAEEVMVGLRADTATRFAGLILNERGYERAIGSGVEEVHYAFPATDTFCERNQGTTVAAASELAGLLIDRAHEDGVRISVTLGASFGCPFEGRVPVSNVVRLAERVQRHGPNEIVLADTIGVGVPSQVRELVTGVAGVGATVGCHFHNTRNTGFANALAAVEAGVRLLDASCAGTGGCPFAPRATGNIATEDLVYLLHGMGYDTGVDLAGVIATAEWLAQELGKELPGQTYKAGAFAPVAA